MRSDALESALALVPPGRWGVGVSGGADSVALLSLLRRRADVSARVIHLDHQTRGSASTADAAFVRALADEWGLPCTVALLEHVEAGIPRIPSNRSARFRAARMALFRDVAHRERLEGVLLAHHADDQAETVLHRLLRGAGPAGLTGMASTAVVAGLTIVRPLLAVRRAELEAYLRAIGQTWREDASNRSDDYLRNRLRRWLAERPDVHDALLALSSACRVNRDWARSAAPALAESFDTGALSGAPGVLARESARRWLVARGAPADELSDPVLERLREMAGDAAAPPRRHFPGGILVRRRGGRMFADGAVGSIGEA